MFKLYDYWRSSAAYRVRIGLNLKGADYQSVPINLLKHEQRGEEYRAINPQGRIPALETPEGLITQSLAILDYLDAKYKDVNPFVPKDAFARAQVLSFTLTIAADIHPVDNTSVLARLKKQFGADEEAIGHWYRHWIAEGFAALEANISKRPETACAFGETPTLADICLVPQCANGRRYNLDFSPYPRLAALDARLRQHPAFVKAAPENQPDAEKG